MGWDGLDWIGKDWSGFRHARSQQPYHAAERGASALDLTLACTTLHRVTVDTTRDRRYGLWTPGGARGQPAAWGGGLA